MKNTNIKIITVFIVFCLIIFSKVIIFSNLHFHVLKNGYSIVHGHPFTKNGSDQNPKKYHHHSQIEHFVISSLIPNEVFMFIS